jgi:F0F1-type ATP synthase epsilon subunit
MAKQTLQVEVRSRQGLMFEGELFAVTSCNKAGPFDVLPGHTNFISMIKDKVILRRHDGRVEEINVANGVMTVENNKVKVFLGITKA